MWRGRDKAIIERIKFVNIPLILVAYNGVSKGRCASENCSVADRSNAPQNVNKTWPGTLITDAFRKSRTGNKSPVRESVRVRFNNDALWVGRAIVGRTGVHI